MSISYLLVVLGIGVFALAVWALFWAIDTGQYEDVEDHGRIPLEPDDEIRATRGASSSTRATPREPPDRPAS